MDESWVQASKSGIERRRLQFVNDQSLDNLQTLRGLRKINIEPRSRINNRRFGVIFFQEFPDEIN